MAGELKMDKRRDKIVELLKKDGTVKVKRLSELLGATSVTIRSDLAALEKEEYLQRISGGAILTPKNTYKVDFNRRIETNLTLKRAIAAKTVEMIPSGSTLMINSGTTTFLVSKELKKECNLNIVTNSIEVALELGRHPTFKVILLGGDINSQYGFLYGNDTIEQMRHYKADYAILSMDGIGPNVGLTTFHAEEALVDRMMVERSRNVILVADSSKFEHEGFYYVSDLSNISTWVTDSKIPPRAVSEMQEKNVKVVIAQNVETSE